jgi:hypothetical protein
LHARQALFISHTEQPFRLPVDPRTTRETIMSEINSDERVVVAKSSINIANIILAITVLIVALGVLKYFGMLPF